MQHWVGAGQLRVAAHDAYLTTGETVGTPAARFPDCGWAWRHIRPRICLEAWPYRYDPNAEAFTTVSNWWGHDDWIVDDRGNNYENNKRVTFLEFSELPRLAPQRLELALYPSSSELDTRDRKHMESRGWRIRDSREVRAVPILAPSVRRPVVRGKFLFVGDDKFLARGVTYGPFRPDDRGCAYHTPEVVRRDFALMTANGVNAVRTYTCPPRWLLDLAADEGLRVMAGVGLAGEQLTAFLDRRETLRAIRRRCAGEVRACAAHPALLAFAIGNEIPSSMARWHGRRRVERFLREMTDLTREHDPEGLVTDVNYPTTEYLQLPFLDFLSYNVYLESPDRFDAYLGRLQSIADGKPLVMAEVGLDRLRNGADAQAAAVGRQVRASFAGGCAGVFVFSWTDEWHTGGDGVGRCRGDDFDFWQRARRAIQSLAMLTPIHSRRRQKRLLDTIAARGLDAVVLGAPHHVYYFAAHWTDWRHLSALVLFADGRSVLYTANEPNRAAAADDVRAYVANRCSTLDDQQPATVGRAVVDSLRERGARRIGADASVVTSQVAAAWGAALEPIDEEIFQARRVKDADELELMRTAIDCCGAMYARAREMIEPGILEVEVFAELQAVAVETAGEPLSGVLGNDYACGVPGGPPRAGRSAEAGELYILDLGPAYRGYFSDNARTIAVDGKPTDEQYAASEIVLGCLSVVEGEARAGVRCRHLWDAVNNYLKSKGRGAMTHHLGHGVGLNPHEYPHLNPEWDDTLMEGEVFTVEPGLYGAGLRGGVRIENQYLVTKGGAIRLTDFPSGLV